jgi:hypothetical protein
MEAQRGRSERPCGLRADEDELRVAAAPRLNSRCVPIVALSVLARVRSSMSSSCVIGCE